MQAGPDEWGGTDMEQNGFVIPGGGARNHEPELRIATELYVATLKCTR